MEASKTRVEGEEEDTAVLKTYKFSYVRGFTIDLIKIFEREHKDCNIYKGLRFDCGYWPFMFCKWGFFENEYVKGFKIYVGIAFTFYTRYFINKR